MKVDLDYRTFAFFKVVAGFFFLLIACLFENSLALLMAFIPLVVGKAHSLGAYIAMWKANKLNRKYVFFVVFLTFLFIWLGLSVLSLDGLILLTYVLFAFHFLFDEFDLQQQKMTLENIVAPVFLFVQLTLYISSSYLDLSVDFSVYLLITVLSFLIEAMFTREINWFFINIKVLTLFTLYCIYSSVDSYYLFAVILTFHYFFWFIFPVYKIHKYKREERDGFILILLIIMATSIFFLSPKGSSVEIKNYAIQYFCILTIVHILSTAPFGYWIGLPKSKYHQ